MNGRRILLLLALLLLALVANLPLRTGLDLVRAERGGLSALAAEGTVWSGKLIDARIGNTPLGEAHVETRFWPLLTGTVRLRITMEPQGYGKEEYFRALGFEPTKHGRQREFVLN